MLLEIIDNTYASYIIHHFNRYAHKTTKATIPTVVEGGRKAVLITSTPYTTQVLSLSLIK